jgi:hypothetical protein
LDLITAASAAVTASKWGKKGWIENCKAVLGGFGGAPLSERVFV